MVFSSHPVQPHVLPDSLLVIPLQPPSHLSAFRTCTLLPQGLCTCSLYVEYSSPTCLSGLHPLSIRYQLQPLFRETSLDLYHYPFFYTFTLFCFVAIFGLFVIASNTYYQLLLNYTFIFINEAQ